MSAAARVAAVRTVVVGAIAARIITARVIGASVVAAACVTATAAVVPVAGAQGGAQHMGSGLSLGGTQGTAQRMPLPTLRDILRLERVDGSALVPQLLDRRVMWHALDHTPSCFAIAYYPDAENAESTLNIRVLDKVKRIWSGFGMFREGVYYRPRTLNRVRVIGPFVYVETHVNPFSSGTDVFTWEPKLHAVGGFAGRILGDLSDGSALYHESAAHVAPTRAFGLGLFDAKTRKSMHLYPRQPYQPLRQQYIARVRERYDAYTRRDPDWARRRNHHADPERFDSALASPEPVVEGRRVAVLVTFGDEETEPPTPVEDVIVTCDLARLPADPCREARKADWLRKHPGASDEVLLKAALRADASSASARP